MESDDPVVRRFVYQFAWLWSFFAISYIVLITVYDIPEKNIRFRGRSSWFHSWHGGCDHPELLLWFQPEQQRIRPRS
jgi:hypothetical protein